ncbi:hypothetical protein TRIATDRAFT_88730 [Trichoderma atroviride IMI 206040]|uniref:Leucine rich repeat protein n=1 Tax=Hypocrea atroviridis (strain ATCC 20476 / IMI 206040) TaxID=452589 RepID=G9NT31_HYPAI|nr:uncharacterized protein TRIATDRAFT_88730 [Trichoderma atroviride IMI 206040]EHK45880.1 hypothetical protein TRIATDRAFT_88730 [Trichoderma atroviride IMI 206040]
MSDEPSLPQLPAVSWDEQYQSFSFNPRKRGRNNYQTGYSSPLLFNSSDPAVFSSDDDPGLDNYVEGRPKKRYVGTWFQQHPATDGNAPNTLQQTRRTLTRDYDSGVFLGSDVTTDADCGSDLDCLKIPSRPRLQPIRLSYAEMAARRKIEECIDRGVESVDLWSMGLEEISDGTIERLGQVANIPDVAKDVAFVPREPELKLFLAKNRLSRLPGSLFDLTHLVVLSLRGNQLTELPPAICKLRNLKQLNLSHNNFSHLPAELLDLLQYGGQLSELNLLANPLIQPQGCIESLESILEPIAEDNDEAFLCPAPKILYRYERPVAMCEVPRYLSRWLGRSPVQFCDSRGQLLSEFRTALDSEIPVLPVEVASNRIGLAATYSPPASTNFRKQATKPSAVPSLLEMALRSCYRSSQLPDLESYMPEGPEHLRKLLRRASSQKDMGGLVCSNCRKTLIVPPMQWIEWRELRTSQIRGNAGEDYEIISTWTYSTDKSEIAVPFLYRACSWNCGPKDLEKDKGWNMLEGYSSVRVLPLGQWG